MRLFTVSDCEGALNIERSFGSMRQTHTRWLRRPQASRIVGRCCVPHQRSCPFARQPGEKRTKASVDTLSRISSLTGVTYLPVCCCSRLCPSSSELHTGFGAAANRNVWSSAIAIAIAIAMIAKLTLGDRNSYLKM